MAILIGARSLTKTFGDRPLFRDISFSVESGERIGLIGPNGAGKSTLLRILAGQVSPDSGDLSVQRGLRVGYLEQVPKFREGSTVRETILEGAPDPDDWEEIARCEELMSKLELSSMSETPIEELSGGWKKRVALARELRAEPDLLLLDEPTNHLDVESILWLEEFIASRPFATVTITHDRVFLQKVSNRILELNRRFANGLLSVRGDYVAFLEAKETLLFNQESSESKLQNTLRRETEWLRRGPKARTTKQQARINRAEALGDEVSELTARNTTQTARLSFLEIERNPKRLVEAKGISLSYGGELVIPKLDLLITPKTRLGLLGPNGCGKSSLIRLLLGQTKPDTGTVSHAEGLQPAYFEQNRESLDPEISVLKTICPVGDRLIYGGQSIHVRTYLDRFLFSGNQVDQPVGRLSGGEQSRLLLARLMLREANFLVLDEPTNDLDMTTLDLLQEVLTEFKGAVLLVSHDRYFLDQVSNQILGFGRDPKGQRELVNFANVAQWENWHERMADEQLARAQRAKKEEAAAKAGGAGGAGKKKLSFKEQRELDGMEAEIEKAETKLAKLTADSAKPEVTSSSSKLLALTQEMSAAQAEVDRLYARWTELTK